MAFHRFSDEHTETMEWILTLHEDNPEIKSNFDRLSVEGIHKKNEEEINPDLIFRARENNSVILVDAKTCPPTHIQKNIDYQDFSISIEDVVDRYTDRNARNYFSRNFGANGVEIAFAIPQRCFDIYKDQLYDRIVREFPGLFSLWIVRPRIEVNIHTNHHSAIVLRTNNHFILPTRRIARIYLTRHSPKKLSAYFILKDLIRTAQREGIRDSYTAEIVQKINESNDPIYYEHMQDREFILRRWNYALRKVDEIKLMKYDRSHDVYSFRDLTPGSSSSKFSQEIKKLDKL